MQDYSDSEIELQELSFRFPNFVVEIFSMNYRNLFKSLISTYFFIFNNLNFSSRIISFICIFQNKNKHVHQVQDANEIQVDEESINLQPMIERWKFDQFWISKCSIYAEK